jgi:hypothetical protein
LLAVALGATVSVLGYAAQLSATTPAERMAQEERARAQRSHLLHQREQHAAAHGSGPDADDGSGPDVALAYAFLAASLAIGLYGIYALLSARGEEEACPTQEETEAEASSQEERARGQLGRGRQSHGDSPDSRLHVVLHARNARYAGVD